MVLVFGSFRMHAESESCSPAVQDRLRALRKENGVSNYFVKVRLPCERAGNSSGPQKRRSSRPEVESSARARRMPRLSKKVLSSINDFAENTSAHGIPRASTSSGLRKVLWLLLFVICLAAFFVQAYHIIKRFSRNDIIVGVELKFENIHFPSVTVCNLNPYKNSLARMMGSVRDTLIAFDDAIEKSDQQKRSKRSVEITSEYTFGRHNCYFTDGFHLPSMLGTVACLCRYSRDFGRPFSCAPEAEWTLSNCSSCDDNSGLCSKTDRGPSKCHCWKEICIPVEFDELTVDWPLTSTLQSCECDAEKCMESAIGAEKCTCIQAFSVQSAGQCDVEGGWRTTKCSDCFPGGVCIRSWTDSGEECLCNRQNACFQFKKRENRRIRRDSPTAVGLPHGIRVRRQIQKLYEKIYSSYEGLLAVYSICECQDNNCKALKNNDGSVCLCFYNKKNGQIWPCYPPEMWSERRCNKCSPLGDCVFNDKQEGKLPCVCAPVIKMCVRIEERTAEEEVLATEGVPELENTTIGERTGNSFVLGNRIPKIWEFTTTTQEAPSEDVVNDREVAYGLKGIEDPVAIRATAVENLIFAVNELNSSEIGRMGYDKREFITKCSFNGRQCSIEDDFSVYIDPSFGNCFTFNYNTSKMIRSERAGSNYGLRFQVFVNITDYLPTTEAAGVRITVHSPSEQPFPDTHGYSAPTGFVSSFAIRLKSINRLPMPYGQCVKDGKDEDYIFQDKEYSTEGCQRTCIQKYLVQNCGCGDPRFPAYRNTSNCPVAVASLRDCLRTEMKNAARLDTCVCQQPCNQEVYTVSYSCARWPSGQAAGTSQECGPLLTAAQCLQFHRDQGALIEVYFEQLNYESLRESEAYGFPNLLSDFGGQLGLWMGVSVITMMEVAVLITEIIISCLSTLCCSTKPAVKHKEMHNNHAPNKSPYIVRNGRSIPFIDQAPYTPYDVIRSFQ